MELVRVSGLLVVKVTPNPASQLNVLWLYGDALASNGAEVGILKECSSVVLGGVLKSIDSVAGPPGRQKIDIPKDFY
jgi:hypothetical protein